MKMISAVLGFALTAAPLWPAAKPGEVAPAFALKDTGGVEHSLKTHAGKWVVLEWVNFGCPFVRKHYGSGNMPALQKQWKEKGVVWLSVNSSAKGKEGYFETEELKVRLAAEKAEPTAYLLDTDGKVGKLYGAKTTPHMFVIDPKGKVFYAGAIDDKPSTDAEDVAGARNYLSAALAAGLAGKAADPASTKSYGCSVKY